MSFSDGLVKTSFRNQLAPTRGSAGLVIRTPSRIGCDITGNVRGVTLPVDRVHIAKAPLICSPAKHVSALPWSAPQVRPSPRKAFRGRSMLCKAAAVPQTANQAEGASLPLVGIPRLLNAFYQFTRPHTMLGTFLSVVSVSLLALGSQPLSGAAVNGLVTALVPALLMNICIVGLNQLFDVDIDKTGIALVLATGASALILGILAQSPPLLATLICSLALGIAYSTDLPFLRWKQYPVMAAMCILCVRAVLVQLGFYFHMKGAMGAPGLMLTRPLLFAMSFMLAFSIVIALFKDIPDIKGDAQAGVRTMSVRVGAPRVFWACITVLEVAYLSAIGLGLASQVLWSRIITIGAHAIMGIMLFNRANKVDLAQPSSIAKCYMYVWKLFYAEYLLIPLFR